MNIRVGLIGAGRMGKVFAHTLVMTRQGVTHDTIPYFMERFGESYTAEIRDFVACILDDRPPSVTGQDARQATAVGIAATLSLDEGRPVLLDEIR